MTLTSTLLSWDQQRPLAGCQILPKKRHYRWPFFDEKATVSRLTHPCVPSSCASLCENHRALLEKQSHGLITSFWSTCLFCIDRESIPSRNLSKLLVGNGSGSLLFTMEVAIQCRFSSRNLATTSLDSLHPRAESVRRLYSLES